MVSHSRWGSTNGSDYKDKEGSSPLMPREVASLELVDPPGGSS